MNWDEFVQAATNVANETGYPLGVLLGQAAQETGRNVDNAPGYNFFGIKGTGPAGSQLLTTWEDTPQGRQNTQANFKQYYNAEDSIRDYVNLIKTKYPDAWRLQNDPPAMIKAIQNSGYATDRNYAQNVMNQPEFQSFLGDKSTATMPEPTNKQFNLATPAQASETALKSAPDYSSPSKSSYTVKQGDTLWGIAQNLLGSGSRWQELQGYKGSPNQLPVGTKITAPGNSMPPNLNSATKPKITSNPKQNVLDFITSSYA